MQRIDFDGKPLKLFRAAFDSADEHQSARDQQCERDYQNFHAFLDMSSRDPERANIAIPKIRAILSHKVPAEVKAAIGQRPYIPFEARRDEYEEQAALMVKMLDYMLDTAGFGGEFVLLDIMKLLYGTSFLEAIPRYETDTQKVNVPETIIMPDGSELVVGYKTVRTPVTRLRFELVPYALWECRFDPLVTNLETIDGCRYVVKIRIVSKHTIKKIAEQGGYGDKFDAGKLDATPAELGTEVDKHRGLEILRSIGVKAPEPDGDMGVLFRYESPERYVDVWNDYLILRDRGNPYARELGGHGLINLSRMLHDVDPHTQAKFWGNGDGKLLEVLNALQNDIFDMTLDNHNFMQHGMTYYAKNRGVQPEQLVRTIGNKVGFDLRPGDRLADVVQDSFGQPLPRDHYALREVIDGMMDDAAGSHEVHRGENMKGDQTLGEISLLRQAGDARQELNIKNIEDPFLKDFGHKCLCHLEQWALPHDKEEVLGPEDAAKLQYLNPRDLPGGYDFTFQGSDRVVNKLIRQRAMVNLDKRIGDSPFVKQDEWIGVLMDAHDLTDEKEKVLRTPEEMALLQLQMAASGEMEGPEEPTGAKMATETGREASP